MLIKTALLVAIIVVVAGLTAVIGGLLVNIFQRKQEAKNPYLRFVDVRGLPRRLLGADARGGA